MRQPARNAFAGDLFAHVRALPGAWQSALSMAELTAVLQGLDTFLTERLAAGAQVFPQRPFRALHDVAPADVQVVILGQDPYHGPNQAQGLAFSVPDDCAAPPSLRNIFTEIARAYPNTLRPQRHSLTRWAKQGVLLLNTTLTVEAHRPTAHAKRGWETITDAILLRVLQEPRPKVLLLWGAHAQSKEALWHDHPPAGPVLVLKANHPSPLSARRPPRPFIGCNHFRAANVWLQARGESGVDWVDNTLSLAQTHYPTPSITNPHATPVI